MRVVLTRDQMFTHRLPAGDDPTRVALGAEPDGTLRRSATTRSPAPRSFEDHQEVVVNWAGLLYHCDNVELELQARPSSTLYTPGDMRAPGAPLGMFALEIGDGRAGLRRPASTRSSSRLRNYTERDENENKPYTSKELRAAYRLGAERFGWGRRNPAPRSMREGRELVGWGMATGVWEAQMMKTSARAMLDRRRQAGGRHPPPPTSAPAPTPS